MVVGKGKWNPQTGYEYTCLRCQGLGDNDNCPDCYGLDYKRIMNAFTTARGKRYYALLKAALSIKGHFIYEHAREIIAYEGRLTVADICHMMVKFDFPANRAKPFFEWLEETRVIPTGTYACLRDRDFKPSEAFQRLGLSG